MGASHQPKFEIGEKGILFVDRDPHLFTHVTAGKQGFLRLEENSRGLGVRDGFGRTIQGIGTGTELLTGEDHKKLDGTLFLKKLRGLIG